MQVTEHGLKLLGAIRRNFELLAEHQKLQPTEVDQIFLAMVTHIRTTHPAALLSFDTGPFGKVDRISTRDCWCEIVAEADGTLTSDEQHAIAELLSSRTLSTTAHEAIDRLASLAARRIRGRR